MEMKSKSHKDENKKKVPKPHEFGYPEEVKCSMMCHCMILWCKNDSLFAQHDMQCAHMLVALSELFQRVCGPPHEDDFTAHERASREGSDPPMTSIL